MAEGLLLIEDEINVGSTLEERLRKEGFKTYWARTVTEAEELIRDREFRLALVDVMLPDGNGFEVAQKLREKHPSTTLIFLTALGSPEDRVRGLELGAEDYVIKPFHLKELLLRIRNVLKRDDDLRSLPIERDTARIGEATVFFSRFRAEREGQTFLLTHKECALLQLLVEKRGQVVSRDEILNRVWSEDAFPSSRTVDNFIVRLRKIVEPYPDQPTVIRNIRGVGYQLV